MASTGRVWASSVRGSMEITGGRPGRSAPSPLPSTLRGLSTLFMIQNLFCQFDVTFRATRARVVVEYWFSETGSFSEPDASRNDGLKDLMAEEVFQIGG